MGRPTTKQEMIAAAELGFQDLKEIISKLTPKELSEPFNFSGDEKKKEAHWKRDKNLRDILIHLYEWHILLINFVEANRKGENKPFLPPPYNWKTYGEMNVELWKKHQSTSLEKASELLEKSHKEIMRLAEGFSDEELFTKSFFIAIHKNIFTK